MRFRRKERLEDPANIFRIDPRSGILHTYQHTDGSVSLGSNPQHPRSTRDGGHGFDRIHDQVQNHLLQLDSIT
jgi:hypothetical protein